MLEIKIILEGWFREHDDKVMNGWLKQDGIEPLHVPGVTFYRKHRDIVGCLYQNQLWVKPQPVPSKVPFAAPVTPTRAQRYDGMIWLDTRTNPPKRMQWSAEDHTWKEVGNEVTETKPIKILHTKL